MTDKTKKLAALIAVGIIAALGGAAIAQAVDGDDDDDETTETVIMSQPDVAADSAAPSGSNSAPVDNGATDQVQQTVDADDQPIAPDEAKRVANAAIEAAGGGSVTDLDRSDDPGEAWEVEVVRDGVEIDIALDEQLNRVENSSYDD